MGYGDGAFMAYINGWGIYGSNGSGIGKVGYSFWEICSKNTGLLESTFPVIAYTNVYLLL